MNKKVICWPIMCLVLIAAIIVLVIMRQSMQYQLDQTKSQLVHTKHRLEHTEFKLARTEHWLEQTEFELDEIKSLLDQTKKEQESDIID